MVCLCSVWKDSVEMEKLMRGNFWRNPSIREWSGV